MLNNLIQSLFYRDKSLVSAVQVQFHWRNTQVGVVEQVRWQQPTFVSVSNAYIEQIFFFFA